MPGNDVPGRVRTNAALVTQAVEAVRTIYTHNFSPAMNVTWRAYPDNLGHLNSAGCSHCHDGDHVNAAGKPITRDCRSGHDILAQGPNAAAASIARQGLPFKHPDDIGDMWQDYQCSFCHDGGLVD